MAGLKVARASLVEPVVEGGIAAGELQARRAFPDRLRRRSEDVLIPAGAVGQDEAQRPRPPARTTRPAEGTSTGTARPPWARRACATTGVRARWTTTRSRPGRVRTAKDSPPRIRRPASASGASPPGPARGRPSRREGARRGATRTGSRGRTRRGSRPRRGGRPPAGPPPRRAPRSTGSSPRSRMSQRAGKRRRSSPRLVVSSSGAGEGEGAQELRPLVARAREEQVARPLRGREPAERPKRLASRSAVRPPTKDGLVTPWRLRLRWPVRYSTLVAAFAIATPGGRLARIHSAIGISRRQVSPAICE